MSAKARKSMSKVALLNAIIEMLATYVPDLPTADVGYDRKTRGYVIAINDEIICLSYGEMLIWLGCVALTGQVMPLNSFDESVEIAVRESLAVRA